jgi:hypothetical protein
MMDILITRLLRTPSSERLLLRNDKGDFASLDLHYLPSGSVQGTLIVFEESGMKEDKIPDLLNKIDEYLLPEVSLDRKNLTFTVVKGSVLGDFAAQENK